MSCGISCLGGGAIGEDCIRLICGLCVKCEVVHGQAWFLTSRSTCRMY